MGYQISSTPETQRVLSEEKYCNYTRLIFGIVEVVLGFYRGPHVVLLGIDALPPRPQKEKKKKKLLSEIIFEICFKKIPDWGFSSLLTSRACALHLPHEPDF